MNKRNYKMLMLGALMLTLSACGGSSSDGSPVIPPNPNPPPASSSSAAEASSETAESSSEAQSSSVAPSSEAVSSSEANSSSEGSSSSDDGLQTFYLYQNSPATLSFEVAGNTVTNTLVPALWNNDGNSIINSNPAGTGPDGETVWDIQFITLPGNVFLTSQSMAGVDGVNDGIVFNNMLDSDAELRFDLFVEAIDSETELQIKLDSGWPNVSYYVLDNLVEGEWLNIVIPIADFQDNNVQPGAVNLDRVLNLFVVEANGTAHILINNVQITCESGCSLGPVLAEPPVSSNVYNLFVGEMSSEWPGLDIGIWQPDGQDAITASIVDDGGVNVLEFAFNVPNTPDGLGMGTMFLEGDPQNLTAYATGELIFELKVISEGNNTSGFRVKADCGYPCGSVELPVPLPADNEWHTITVSISDLTGLDLSNVNAPFSFFPVFGGQDGVVFRLANIRWEAGED